ncbi:MAG: hypothetical protein QW802_03460 [Candidatus Altiarchaeota archaeon]
MQVDKKLWCLMYSTIAKLSNLSKNKRGIETSPFFLLLAGIILFLTALLIFPIFREWQAITEREKAISETKKIITAINSVYTLGDIGSTEQIFLNLPPGYNIEVKNSSILLKREINLVKEYSLDVELIYRGNKSLDGPGKYNLTIVYWIRNDSTNLEKEYLIEVLT